MSIENVLVVDDHHLFRAALVRLLQTILGNSVSIQAVSSGEEALEIARGFHSTGVILLDVQMPGMNGIEVLCRLRKQHFTGGILMVSQFDAPSLVEHAINFGANGYLNKNCTPDDLLLAIRAAAEGKFFDNEIAQEWRKHFNVRIPQNSHYPSPREFDLLNHLRHGKSTKEIADLLSLSVNTIESYRKNLMNRAHAKNVAELINWGFEMGFIHSEIYGSSKRNGVAIWPNQSTNNHGELS
ncbi:MAG: response regulator [Cyclobacteriaceae bacterium]|jgi:two-component system invasion response regulator UvrY